MSSQQIIEINGRKYDAVSGQLLDKPAEPSAPKSAAKKTQAVKPATTGAVLDGFVRRNVQKSKTLMRPSVKKPELKIETAKSKPVHKLSKPHAAREHRAKSTPKSSHVTKFGRSQAAHQPAAKAEVLPAATQSLANARHQGTVEQFEKAMHQATSHLQEILPSKKKTKTRRVLISSAAVLSLAVLAFGAYQFIPIIKVKYAGTRAGFSAQLPDYSPAGFGLASNVGATSGEVTLAYQSRTDDKGYKITQSPSNWNSQALLANYVIPSGKPYQTYQEQGKTVYIYDNSNATWVDGGIWYRLEGDARLTSDQLLRIANGL